METTSIHTERVFRTTTVPSRQVRVGSTPVARYATWDDHRHELHRMATEAKARVLARRAS